VRRVDKLVRLKRRHEEVLPKHHRIEERIGVEGLQKDVDETEDRSQELLLGGDGGAGGVLQDGEDFDDGVQRGPEGYGAEGRGQGPVVGKKRR
jgi:hypothetical protein